MNRGKVVGPVPWPLWPYVRGTGRAGMGHTPPLNLGVVGESMWSPASRSQATLYRNLTRLEHAGPPGPRGRQGQRTRARRAGARQGPRDGQTERGKAQSRARPQDFFKMFSAGGVVGVIQPAAPRTPAPQHHPDFRVGPDFTRRPHAAVSGLSLPPTPEQVFAPRVHSATLALPCPPHAGICMRVCASPVCTLSVIHAPGHMHCPRA